VSDGSLRRLLEVAALAGVMATLMLGASVSTASAATFTVTNTDGSGHGSLRDACASPQPLKTRASVMTSSGVAV
jgi:hypothetical protein